MAGYFDDPTTTAAALTSDGWLKTSDVGYCDADGWFYFTDRSRNVIKRAGINISATEIEAVLESHPGVAEAAVIGIPDAMRDEAVKAFIRPVPGAAITQEDILAHCGEQLAGFKMPGFIEFVADFPRTDSMKIAKRELYDRSTTTPTRTTG
jgi:crotonobetaine/carnitine-CoA ligase